MLLTLSISTFISFLDRVLFHQVLLLCFDEVEALYENYEKEELRYWLRKEMKDRLSKLEQSAHLGDNIKEAVEYASHFHLLG